MEESQLLKTTLTDSAYAYLKRYLGESNLNNICFKLCSPPSVTSLRVDTLQATTDEVVERLNANVKEDHMKWSKHPSIKDAVIQPITGPHQVERTHKVVIVDRKCGEAVLRGSNVFAPGVMYGESGLYFGDSVSVFVALDTSKSRGAALSQEEMDAYRNGIFVGNGKLTMSRTQIFRENHGVAIEMTDKIYRASPLNNLLERMVFPQNLPSILCSHVLDPQPYETVLDACAAPGGKTVHLATLMKNKGLLVACDRSHAKVNDIRKNISRFELDCVYPLKMDATKSCLEDERGISPKDLKSLKEDDPLPKGFLPNSFDKVLLDAPCTSLGVRPKLAEDITDAQLISTAQYQRKIADTVVRLVRPGGILVYSTCSFNPGENEDVVAHILKRNKDFRLVPVSDSLTLGSPGVPSSELGEEDCKLVQRFDPSTHSDSIGFFIAKFTKLETTA